MPWSNLKISIQGHSPPTLRRYSLPSPLQITNQSQSSLSSHHCPIHLSFITDHPLSPSTHSPARSLPTFAFACPNPQPRNYTGRHHHADFPFSLSPLVQSHCPPIYLLLSHILSLPCLSPNASIFTVSLGPEFAESLFLRNLGRQWVGRK